MAILSALELKDFRLERRRTGCPSSAYLEAMSRSARSSLEKHPRTAHLPAALGPLLGSPSFLLTAPMATKAQHTHLASAGCTTGDETCG